MLEVYEAVVECLKSGARGCLVTVVQAQGSAPAKTGFKMFVRVDGTTVGTVGGGVLEAKAIEAGLQAMQSGSISRMVYGLGREDMANIGMACGGSVEVLVEPVGAGPVVLIFGAGHVGRAIGQVGKVAGYRVIMVDDRPEFAAPKELPYADQVICSDMVLTARTWVYGPDTMAVIVTRGHQYDRDVLYEVLTAPSRPGYVGMIGSHAKVTKCYEDLSGKGVSREDLLRVHAPIGIDIGAETPGEIGVSVVAQLIACQRRPKGE